MAEPALAERERELAGLAEMSSEAAGADGAGSLALVFGEAGIGKSALIRAVRARLPADVRFLVGQCDDLATPRTLGPFRDLIGSVGTELTAALRAGDRDAVLTALHGELDRPGQPTVLVVEDAHWADDATLDVLRYLVRRIAGLPVVLVLTYRDEELTRTHPLQQVLGAAPDAGRVRRFPLRRLSEEAVRRLSATTRLDAARLYSLTAGNPFFVNEILAAGDVSEDSVPGTVVDAVLARVRRLDAATVDAVEQLAAIPSTVERWLVDALVPGGLVTLAPAEERGLLVVSPASVAFRHELVRRAIVDTVPVARQVALNKRVLRVLVGRDGADLSRIVHHATRAGDVAAVVRYAPLAGREASAAGAHREAAAHYTLALQYQDSFAPAERAELLERCAIERHTIGDVERTLAIQLDAIALRRSLGDPVALGADLRWLSRMYWFLGDRDGAERAAAEAIEVLETAGDDRLLAYALSNQAQLYMLAQRIEESVPVGERAIDLARKAGDPIILAHALNNVGSGRLSTGDLAGEALMLESLRLARGAGSTEEACRAYVNLLWLQVDGLRLADAARLFPDAVALAERSDQVAYWTYLHVILARLRFARSAWNDAEGAAQQAVNGMAGQRCPALTVLGRVRVRRGEPGGVELLRDAWKVAQGLRELQRLGPVAAGLAEAAWLDGDPAQVRAAARPVYEQARDFGHPPLQAELGYWLIRAGDSGITIDSDHPYAIQAAGRWREAASAWEAIGCRYEYAAALAESPEPDDRLAALTVLDELGAAPLARLVRAGLRELGVAHIPRGPAMATRANPAGLTERQVQVLKLLSDGHTNAEIADRLVVSVRTVDSHVTALLAKLGVESRREAAVRAAELGILDA